MNELVIHDITFQYSDSSKVALDNINLHLEKGSFCLLVGPSGSGKTTLLKCIKRELAPAGTISGSMSFNGEDLLHARKARNVAFVPQDPNTQIVCDTVQSELAFSLENLGLPQDVMERRIAEANAYFGLSGLIQKKTHELSDGEKQLVSLASACITAPDVLLLDEPTSHLDGRAKRAFCSTLFDMNRDLGMTVIVATHSPELFKKYANCAASLIDGHLEMLSVEDLEIKKRAFSSHEDPPDPKQTCYGGSRDDVALQMKDVSFKFEGSEESCFKGLYLNVRAHSVFSLLGSNGSGKTTLLKLAAGIIEPEHGKVIRPYSGSQAYLPQDVRLLFSKDTVREELLEVGKVSSCSIEEIDELVRSIGLMESMDAYPYDLSDGQRQLLGLAKICLSRSKMVLLDEPTSAMDDASVAITVDLIKSMVRSGSTVILSTHNIRFAARVSDVCSMIFDGRITQPVDPNEFFGKSVFMKDALR